MLWAAYPSSESFPIDSCSHLHLQVDAGGLACSLLDSGLFKKRENCGTRVYTWGGSTSCALKMCRQTIGRSASLVNCNLPSCMDAQVAWRGSGAVLESLPRSSGRGLEAQLKEIKFTNFSEEGLSSRLVSEDLFDRSRSNGKKHNMEDSVAEGEDETIGFVPKVGKSEEKRLLDCSKSEDVSVRLRLKLTSIRSPACHPDSLVSRSTVNETMLYLESIGVDCGRVISEEPRVVACNVHSVRKLVHALEYYGLKRKELGRIINICPRIVHLTVANDVQPVVNFLLEEIEFPRKNVGKLIKRCPRLLAYSIDEQLRPTLLFLRTLGFSRLGGVISSNPALLAFSVEKNLVPKLEYLKSLGLSHKEATNMVLRFPAIFNYSVKDNLKLKYDYLVNEIGGSLKDLVAFPQYFGYSLEKKIKPRHQYITKHNKQVSLAAMLKTSDFEFLSVLESKKPELCSDVAFLLKEANHVKISGAVLKSLTMSDLRVSETPVLIGAGRS